MADLVTGEESLANKGNGRCCYGRIGGAAGFAMLGGPLGASIGASFGKTVSDGTQALFLGGGKSPEERKLEEALACITTWRIKSDGRT